MQVLHYLDSRGHDVYQDWLDGVRDITGRVAVQRRIDRIVDTGNLGSHSFCRDGVWELKVDIGPGYRVYYVEVKKTVVLLLCGGTKRSQERDITHAVKYWKDYQQRL
ncbi:addiction module killer protein [Candidatus Kaiserbacteria bacterium GWA2_50_9]|uniref:Addiction module killer protein n=1 Tax=Candidatus Kaiserbacteria bacterium GWA2_50_9 TaxID=1798474 RepID=A0A1F6BWT6_9BACT|nr:MAG: addiction module killer protein [Candidatus Kaiserbacteria bacterium GWA2_50_9]